MSELEIEREAITLFEAFLSVPDAERTAWLDAHTAGRPDLRTRLTRMEAADRSASIHTGGALAALEDEAMPERIGAYKIVELIGRGGMGAVYRAERDAGDFSRTVAIKVIKPGLFTPDVVERFERERQTLATLTHPNIARLYDGGQTEQGSPYIVMEYIDGSPLLQWAAAREIGRSERVRIFRDICAAVAFAHSRLIVHRDLTPSNVLLTADGTVKLIDFGISKPADDDAGAPADARAAAMTHTPGYAAPERLVNSQVTTAADIYSLGRLLQDLLPPGAGDDELRAIITRASADDPQIRYPSADALIAEIDAWRSDRPVGAYSGSRVYTMRKFIARHTRAVAAGAATFVLLLAALGATLAANVRAERARQEAEARFQQTREIAKAMLFDVFDEVSATTGSTRAREILARTGLSYLEALAADETAPTDVRVEAALGFLRLAQVVGGGQVGELGRYRDASALLERAEGILNPLYEAQPQSEPIARAFAQLLLERTAGSLFNDNDTAAARTYAIRARDAIEPYARDDAEAARIYAVALQGLGDTYAWDDDYQQAKQHHLAAEVFIAGLPESIRGATPVMRAHAAISRLLGESHHKLGEVEEARVALDRAVALNRAVRDGQPNDPRYVRNLAVSLWYRAVVHRTNGRDALARESIEESMAIARTLRERDPNDAGALRMVAISGEVYAQVLADAGRHEESYALGNEVIAAHRGLVQRAESAPGARRSLTAALMTHGGNSYNAGRYDRACQAWREALSVLRDLDREGVMAEGDRNDLYAQAQDYNRRACNPPRAGLGSRI